MSSIKPISPQEMFKGRRDRIPPQVVEAFNAMITKHWDGHNSSFTQKEVMTAILQEFEKGGKEMSTAEVYAHRWLDVEDLFESEGWEVTYDKPGYNEAYDPTFTFVPEASKDE